MTNKNNIKKSRMKNEVTMKLSGTNFVPGQFMYHTRRKRLRSIDTLTHLATPIQTHTVTENLPKTHTHTKRFHTQT